MKILESLGRVAVVAVVALVWILMFGLPFARANDSKGNSPSASASSSASVSGSGGASSNDSRAYGLGSGSPSANACQRMIFFGFSADVVSCQLQQWATILGDKPSPAKLQVACQDDLLRELPMCKGYALPRP